MNNLLCNIPTHNLVHPPFLSVKSNPIYDQILQVMGAGIVICDWQHPDHPIVHCNPVFAEMTGYDAQDLIGRNSDFLKREENPQQDQTPSPLATRLKAAIRDQQTYQVILKHPRRDGTFFWDELTAFPIVEESGQITHWVEIHQDITDRQLETKLRQLMQFSLERSADATFFIKPTGHIWYVNEAATELLGYSKEELCRLTIPDIAPGYSQQAWEQHWQQLKEQGSFTLEASNQTKDGRIIPIEITVNYIEFNGQEYNCAFTRDISDRKATEAQIREKEEQYRLLARNIPNGVVLLFDRDFRYLLAEGKGLETIGLSKESIEGRTLGEVFSPEVAQTFTPGYQAALAGESRVWEYEYLDKHFLVNTAPIYDENGTISGGMVTTQEITQQKQNEHQLRSLATREQLVSQIAQRIRQSLDLKEVLNTAVEEVRNVLETDRVVLYRFNPDHSGDIVVESVGEGWTPVVETMIQDDCFLSSLFPLYQQGRVRAIHDIYNVGLDECHIEMLAQFEVKANLVVPVIDQDNLWGLLIAHHCRDTRHWQDQEIQLLKQLSVQLGIAIRQAALFEQVETELKERSRTEAALRESQSQLEQAFRDLQKTQTQLIQTEKMSSLGQLVAGIAHEVNNPISFIQGNISHAADYMQDILDLLNRYQDHYPNPDPDLQEALDDTDLDFIASDFPKLLNSMKVGVERVRNIVQSLRNFSRLDEADCKPVDLHEGLDNTLVILQSRLQSNKVQINVEKQYGELPQVDCYAGLINQVFMNLLNNAVDTLESKQQETPDFQPQLTLRTEFNEDQDPPHVIIRVQDNGKGIPEDIKTRIFDPFYTSKPVGKGTGLGLSICYQIIVEKHGGEIDCISHPDQGTEFIIKIPVHRG
ncbi:PAS domain S-box protein [Spirulina sp. CS-785/01]|uniref:PAS domain S-box protein n=1 Tax=Spirulina sp. CS-785/01 TaxID=3021716 RepID=UPI00232EA319|nr:PAS domain S-box protein [Spirulina sp. CS-785/01]MDB9313557.1 PAS domain S-box protein [Spirulina sp. CS-785/01]